jgi:CHAT domain-containing protein/tetratricopeptide (TPR) repeat protein
VGSARADLFLADESQRVMSTRRTACLVAAAFGIGRLVFAGAGEAPRTEIRELLDRGHYREAEAAARALLEATQTATGSESLDATRAIDLLVEALRRGGKAHLAESRRLAERAIRIKEAKLGPDDPDLATSLQNLADLRLAVNRSAPVEGLCERTLAIRERVLGLDHPDVAGSLDCLARISFLKGQSPRARALAERALEIRQKAYGADDPRLAPSMQRLAMVLADLGDMKGTERLFERALAILEASFGPDHPDVAMALGDLAWATFWDGGDYDRATAEWERALGITERSLGPDSSQTVWILGDLAIGRWHMGDYVAARSLMERSLSGAERIYGPDDLSVAARLNDLGLFYYFLGDYDTARPLHERALAIREKIEGPEGINVTRSLNNLAMLFTDTGDYARAKPLVERAVANYEKAGRVEETDFARILNTLANLLYEMGDTESARRLFERDIAIWEKTGNAEHPDLSLDLNSLAELLLSRGDLQAARPLFERALAIRKKRLGPDHPAVARTLADLARLRWLAGDGQEALDGALRSEAIARTQFRATARSLTEKEALRYEQVRVSGLDVALSVLVAAGATRRTRAIVGRVWDEEVRSRGTVLDEMAKRHRTIAAAENADIASLVTALDRARNRLARMVIEGPGDGPAEEYGRGLERAREEKEGAERALADRSASFRRELAGENVGLAEMEKALPASGALVAYVRYGRQMPPKKQPTAGAAPSRVVPSYLAFVQRSDGADPVMVPLGPASRIESRVRAWREEVAKPPAELPVAGGRAEDRYRTAGSHLRQAIWDPLVKHLRGADLVFVVPDGVMHLVNLATLPVGEDRYLVESGPLIHYLSSEREVVRPAGPPGPAKGLLAVGGVDFDARVEALAEGVEDGSTVATASLISPADDARADSTPRSTCADFRSLKFAPLPYSRLEVDEIESLWRERLSGRTDEAGRILKLTGARAGRETFRRSVAGRQVVHLATHAFFAQDRCPSVLELARGIDRPPAGGKPRVTAILGDDPLLLSGLALAGANRRDAARRGEDGILTAEEIASLDLSGVQWVVLSACETGIGKVQVGEGVLGLRRAFEIAGADTLILSLWSVADAAAREWMRGLYEARLSGRTTTEAVRQASLAMIQKRRDAGLSIHPADWGAFVATGDWR